MIHVNSVEAQTLEDLRVKLVVSLKDITDLAGEDCIISISHSAPSANTYNFSALIVYKL